MYLETREYVISHKILLPAKITIMSHKMYLILNYYPHTLFIKLNARNITVQDQKYGMYTD